MKRKTYWLFIIMLPLIFLFVNSAFAEGIQDRMKNRLPAIAELKKEGVIGENNLGYLEYVGVTKKGEDIISAENNDRKLVYEAIAKKENTTAALVGELRAKKIAEKADPGDWIKDESGKWYQK